MILDSIAIAMALLLPTDTDTVGVIHIVKAVVNGDMVEWLDTGRGED